MVRVLNCTEIAAQAKACMEPTDASRWRGRKVSLILCCAISFVFFMAGISLGSNPDTLLERVACLVGGGAGVIMSVMMYAVYNQAEESRRPDPMKLIS